MAKIDELLQELCPDRVEWKTIKELFETRNGYTPSTKNSSFWTNGDIPWFKMEDIRDKGHILSDAYSHITKSALKGKGLFKANSIILATSATIGEHALITVDHLSNQRFTNIYPKEKWVNKIHMKFVYYYMYLIDEWCKTHVKQGSFAAVDMDGFYKQEIPIPPLSIQQEIVEVLDTFTDAISNLEEELALREKQFQYYQDTLLNFDGETKFISFGESFQLKARIGWQGLTKKEYRSEGNYKLVTGTDFTANHRIDFNTCVFVDKDRYDQDKYIQLKNDDVLITKDGTLGKIAYIENLPYPTTLNGGVFVVRNITGELLQKFTMHYLASSYFKTWISSNHTTGSIKHLTQKLLVKFNIPVPPIERQQEIVEILDTFEAMIANIKEEIALRTKQYEYYREKLLSFGK